MSHQIIASAGLRLGHGSIGNIVRYAVTGFHEQGLLKRVICGSSGTRSIPADKIRALGLLNRAIRRIVFSLPGGDMEFQYRKFYDSWAKKQLVPGDVFYGWDGYGLQTLQLAKAMGLITILDRPLAHPIHLQTLMRQEHEQLGLQFRWPRIADFVNQEIQSADIIVTPSPYTKETFLENNVAASKLITVPFGVDSDRFRPGEYHGKGEFIVLFVGQISIRKGAHYLLEAWRRLHWSNAELWFVGHMHLPEAIQNKYRSLPSVRYLGHASAVEEIYRKADVFILPSLGEGSALVTYEAMASGVPLVVTEQCGSVLQEDTEGFKIPYRDPQAIMDRLELLRSSEKLRERMAKAGRVRALEYSWDRYQETLLREIQEVPGV